MNSKVAEFAGNVFLIITILRILLGVSSLTHNLLLNFGSVILLIFIFVFCENMSPTQGKARMWRGLIFLVVSIIVSVIILMAQHI
jgi:hypothetical protein